MIRNILSAFRGVPFPIVVESLLGQQVESIDMENPRNVSLIDEIAALADAVAHRFHTAAIDRQVYYELTGRRPSSFRNNEVGILAELAFVEAYEHMEPPLHSIQNLARLPATGYPDMQITDIENRTTYMDIKATSRPDQGSPRDFYISPGQNTTRKVSTSARHLVLGFVTREIEPGHFIISGWELFDLSTIKVSMKAEFNADNIEMYKAEAIIRQRSFD